MTSIEAAAIRAALAAVKFDVSSSIDEPPEPRQIYAPPDHGSALDPARALVVGARGMGKSFWAGAYTSSDARVALAQLFPKLGLDRLTVAEGFTAGEGGAAPSRRIIEQLLQSGTRAEDIWRAVALKSVRALQNEADRETSWRQWIADANDAEKTERLFRSASDALVKDGRSLVIVFDALDRLADNWPEIRQLTTGLLRVALDFRTYRGVKFKIFMRADQFDDDALFAFPDASKLKAEAVRLEWHANDLYGLLFTYLARDERAEDSFAAMVSRRRLRLAVIGGIPALPSELRDEEDLQEDIFNEIAGRYMGADHRKGRTYTWLINHLMDARGEISPRSFLQALSAAARNAPAPQRIAIDANGIREGIKAASRVRFDQLLEDYPWARVALDPLAEQSVPCDERDFLQRWGRAGTIRSVAADKKGPIELIDSKSPDRALLEALSRLGVVERRDDGRINMPDIYRLAARLLRKGGVAIRRRR